MIPAATRPFRQFESKGSTCSVENVIASGLREIMAKADPGTGGV